MRFENTQENYRLIQRLEEAVKSGRVSHAYLFEGPETVDKEGFCRSLIKGIICPDKRGVNCGKCELCDKVDHDNHEDIMYIRRDGKSVKDAAIIQMQERLKVKPLGGRNIAVICDSDLMTDRAQNRLLKTLEEPLGDTILILLSENMENLTSTVLSRCVKYRINGSDSKTGGKKAEARRTKAAELIDAAARKEPYYKLRGILNMKSITDDEANLLLDEMELVYRNKIIDNDKKGDPYYDFDGAYHGIYEIEEARKQIRMNVSASYAIKNLLLKIGG
ncbi:MAG: hypothetical protein Q4A65_05735 [Bacillota bacterium]|nr:hypothetical protein [Bacillota bacterium]